MELNDEQKQTVAQWVKDGLGLSGIQKKISEEFGVRLTYVDVRFLVIDLGLDLRESETSRDADAPKPLAEPSDTETAADPSPGGVSVEVDRLVKPGAVVSGTVTFSDGVTAAWLLDQMGRLALDAGNQESRPTEEDLRAFQEEIRTALQRRGF